MTTIAYKSGVLACDKQMTGGGARFRASTKLVQTETYAYVVTGELAHGLAFIKALEEGEESPELKKATVLRMDMHTGHLVAYESPGYPLPIEDSVYADGSGFAFALGAMAMGADPEQAVKIAAKYDVSTGMGVQVVRSTAAQKRLRKKRK